MPEKQARDADVLQFGKMKAALSASGASDATCALAGDRPLFTARLNLGLLQLQRRRYKAALEEYQRDGGEAAEAFFARRLDLFGPYQDAMWTGTPWGWHALLSTSLNLHLLHPREVVEAVEAAWRAHGLPLASVEGFIRQVLGWREFIRGVYWLDMPGLREANFYGHQRPLPAWYWTGDTRMACMREVVGQTRAQAILTTGKNTVEAQVMDITQKLLDDAAFDVAAWLSSEVGMQFAEEENDAFTNGNGIGGTNWTGGAYDPETHIAYVYSTGAIGTMGLVPPPAQIRIHPRQGTSDPNFAWGDRENVIYEVIR